jgi:hypothetical protein
MKTYDVTIEITNIEAKDEKEAIYLAREKAKVRDCGYVEVKEVEE